MEKIKSFIFNVENRAKLIVGFLLLILFSLIFGKIVFAQFVRETGDTGWGYGYGWGYGPGYGTSDGSYRTDSGAADEYLYGYGYGNLLISAPTNLVANGVSSSEIDLSWTAVSGATSYKIYDSTDNYTSVKFTTTDNSYSVTELSAGTSRSYEVSAVDANGEGSKTAAVSAMTYNVLSADTATTTITTTNNATTTVTAPSTVTNPALDLSDIVSNDTATTPCAIAAQVSVGGLGTVTVDIPSSTVISAASTWDGQINLPTVKSSTSVSPTVSSGNQAAGVTVIELGFADVALTFDKGVRILVPGQAGKQAGYSRNSIFTEITSACSADSQSAGDALAAGAECKIDSGSDLVIWTKHFTKFTTYSQSIVNGGWGGGGPSLLDNTAPTGALIKINDGAISTTNILVALTLFASDPSTPLRMMISNSPTFVGANWESYTVSKSWYLEAGLGVKTVYAKFMDAYNNISNVVSASINIVDKENLVTPENPPVVVNTPEQPPTVLNEVSKVVLTPVAKSTYLVGSNIKFDYQYKNESEKNVMVKITRQLLDKQGKQYKTVNANVKIKAGSTFNGKVNEALPRILPVGTYTVQVRVVNGKSVETNSFKINVEKPKKKVVSIGDWSTKDSNISFSSLSLQQSLALPTNFFIRYTYANNTGAKQRIKVIRELVDPTGKVLDTKSGLRSVKVGGRDSLTFQQSLKGNLLDGDYLVKINIYDAQSNSLLDENGLKLVVGLK